MIRLSPCFLLFFIAGTPYDVDRAVFRFQIRLGQVFSHNSHTEKLDATHKQDHTDHRRPSCHRISPDQCPYYQNQNHKKRNSAEYHAEHCCHRQRSHRKPGNSLQRIFKKLAQGPLGLSRRPLHILILQPFGPESHPAEDSFGKTVILTHLQHGIHHLPAHDPVISGTVYQLRF